MEIQGKCSDCFVMWQDNKEYMGYVPDDVGIGGGDEVEFKYCLECGQIQDKFPVTDSQVWDEMDDEQEESGDLDMWST